MLTSLRRISTRIYRGIITTITLLTVMAVTLLPSSKVWADNNAMSGFYSVTGGQALTANGVIQGIAKVATDIFGILTAVAALFGIIYIMIGGFQMMGGGRKKEEGTERIKYALIGIAVALCAGVLTAVAALFAGDFTKAV